MSLQPQNDFQDPALKQAVRRCWMGECASEQLRRRVVAVLAEKDVDSSQAGSSGGLKLAGGFADPRVGHLDGPSARETNSRLFIGRAWTWPVAAAAAVVLSFSLFLYYRSAQSLPETLASGLIATHDACSKSADHQHLTVAINDSAGIERELGHKLQRAVLVDHPQDPAWRFLGASICPVNRIDSGHLVFLKGADALSIFSLPKSVLPDAAEGSVYASTVDQHSIVGFVKDGAVFCIVGSGPDASVTLDQLEQMRSSMESKVASSTPLSDQTVAMVELLRPVR
jgi:hypothetical protein